MILEWSYSPIKFIEDMWGLVPQPLKREYQDLEIEDWSDVQPEWFEGFVKGKNITWQQWLVLLSIEQALLHNASARVSVKSGHGIGKDALASWLILWYLLCFENAQVPCTAPTHDQLYAVLWKEIAVWLLRMPEKYKNLYEWNGEYVRMKARPETWFARARTGRKESPEALAGMHGEFIFIVVDEASGVDDIVFETMEGALTGLNYLLFMISNPTRTTGYFYDSFNKNNAKWQNLTFNSEQSPIVEEGYTENMADTHGADSDEYRVRVAGEFPRVDMQDDRGYMPLFTEDILHFTEDPVMPGKKRLGVDPSGEGADESAWAVRSNSKLRIVATEQVSNPKRGAQKTLTQMDYYAVDPQDVTVDNFGVGADWGKEIVLLSPGTDVFTVNVGEEPLEEQDLYMDRRAQAFWRMRQWCQNGAEIVFDKLLKAELLAIKFRRDNRGRIQIMSKREAKKEGLKSPNRADAAMLTFVKSYENIVTNARGSAKVVRTKAGRRRK